MARTIEGMVCIITGASAGIGEALARGLSARGAKLVLAARRLERLEELNGQLGGGHQVVQADVSHQADCRRLIQEAQGRFGRIDTLICNAGYGLIAPIARTTEAQWMEIFRTNVLGTTGCIEAAVPLMRVQEAREGWRGQIMIVSSAAARRGLPFFGAYSATKAAQLSVAEALRVELHRARIAVTSVHPVGTNTDFFRTAEQVSSRRVPWRGAMQARQSVERVAAAMEKGIARPRPEVWPMRSMRWGVGMGALMPRLVDRVLRGHGSSET
jgi:short-subunit dehydrogenase